MEISVAVVTFILGVISTVIVQAWLSRISEDISAINSLIVDIEKIEKLAIDYWAQAGGTQESKKLEAQLHGTFKATSHFDSKRICASKIEEFRALDVEIHDSITGGDFEGSDREPDYKRIILIMNNTQAMRHHLRIVKRSQYWIR